MDQAQYLTHDVILLILSQKDEINGPFTDVRKEVPAGWLRIIDGEYKFMPLQIRKDEELSIEMLLRTAHKVLLEPKKELTTQNGLPGAIKKVAQRFNEWGVRIIYWDIEDEREMARRVIAVAGSLGGNLIW